MNLDNFRLLQTDDEALKEDLEVLIIAAGVLSVLLCMICITVCVLFNERRVARNQRDEYLEQQKLAILAQMQKHATLDTTNSTSDQTPRNYVVNVDVPQQYLSSQANAPHEHELDHSSTGSRSQNMERNRQSTDPLPLPKSDKPNADNQPFYLQHDPFNGFEFDNKNARNNQNKNKHSTPPFPGSPPPPLPSKRSSAKSSIFSFNFPRRKNIFNRGSWRISSASRRRKGRSLSEEFPSPEEILAPSNRNLQDNPTQNHTAGKYEPDDDGTRSEALSSTLTFI